MSRELEFTIDAWTPETIPQERLGQYMIELARLYGEPHSVHFAGVKKGSLTVRSRVDEPAVPKVRRRLMEARQAQAPSDVVGAFRRIDTMLASDNATGRVRAVGSEGTALVITFPGRERPVPVEYSGIREEGLLEGEIIRIGGKDKSVHVWLETADGMVTTLECDRGMARRLGPLIFGPVVRLVGTGTWARSAEGAWSLTRFVVRDFATVEDTSLADALPGIRAIGGSRWSEEADPISTLLVERHGVSE